MPLDPTPALMDGPDLAWELTKLNAGGPVEVVCCRPFSSVSIQASARVPRLALRS